MQYSREELNNKIAAEFDIDVSLLVPEANILKTLQVDSLGVMELVVLVKKTTGVLVPTLDLPGIVTFGHLYDYIEDKLISENKE